MIACALRHLLLETFGVNISLSSLLISVWLNNWMVIKFWQNSWCHIKATNISQRAYSITIKCYCFLIHLKQCEYVDGRSGFTLQILIIVWNGLYNNFEIIICNGFIYGWIVNLLLPCVLSWHVRTKVPY